MKYIVKKLNDDFIFDELEQVRKNFVSALTYTIESAKIFFNQDSADPLDIFIQYDFEQKAGKSVIHGFNLSEEIARNFKLDVNEYHASERLLMISEKLKVLAKEIDRRYKLVAEPSVLEIREKQATEYAKKVNRSYKQVLKDAEEEDKKLKQEQIKNNAKEFIDAEYQIKSAN
jgi:hypothetical protein